MDERDGRIRAAYRHLTEPTDVGRSADAIRAAIHTAGRRRRDGIPPRFVASAAAALLVASAGWAAIVLSQPSPTTPPGEEAALPSGGLSIPGTGSPISASEAPPPAAPAMLTWHRQPLDGPPAGPGTMAAVTSGGPGLVAVGHATDTGHHHNTPTSERHHAEALAWWSFDGTVWWRVAGQPGFEHAVMQDVAWSRGVLVAVGYDDSDPAGVRTTRIWTSRDGATWTVLPDGSVPGETRLTRVLGRAEGFLAPGGETTANGNGRGVIWRSDDGTSWARATDPAAFGGAGLSALFNTGDGMVAVGDAQEGPYGPARHGLWRSNDGAEWEAVLLPEDAFGTDVAGIAAVSRGGQGYIAVGTVIDTLSPQDPVSTRAWPPTDGAIWTSPDLRTWTRVEPARELFGGEEDQTITSLVAIRDGYLAFGSSGAAASAWSSPDGERWARVDLPEAASGRIDAAVVTNGSVVGVGGADGAPAVWRGWAEDAAVSPAAITGIAYPIAVYTHCGLDRSRFDFDGRLWKAIGETSDGAGNPPDGYDDPYDGGTIRLLEDGTAEYTSSRGVRLGLGHLDRPAVYGCD